MDLRASLQEGFDYDLWANRKWLEALPNLPFEAQARRTLDHIVGAQHIWLTRCLSEEEAGQRLSDLAQDLEAKHAGWTELLRTCDPGAFVSYTTLSGDSWFNTVEQIARHVVNHGTYHRGQLRGLAEAAEFMDFPETDLIRFFRE